jgi:hypothetical protein
MSKIKNEITQPGKSEATPQPSAPETIIHAQEPPSPDFLVALAGQEPNRRELEEYSEVIRVLRNEKKFTFREISKWLSRNGLVADHNAVYREYTRGMPPQYAQQEALEDEATEREEQGF